MLSSFVIPWGRRCGCSRVRFLSPKRGVGKSRSIRVGRTTQRRGRNFRFLVLDDVALLDAGLVVYQVPAVGQTETSRAGSVHSIAFDLKHCKMSHHRERFTVFSLNRGIPTFLFSKPK